jgi:hypothetical protein
MIVMIPSSPVSATAVTEIANTEELGTGHEEHPPAGEPALGVVTIGSSKNWQKTFSIAVHLRQPRLQRHAVVEAADAPLIDDLEVIVVAPRQVL